MIHTITSIYWTGKLLRTIEAQFQKKLRTTEAHFECTGPYKKKRVKRSYQTLADFCYKFYGHFS